MCAFAISDTVYCVHADIQTSDLFEGIWSIKDGVSLNSYVVKGEKIAFIDLVKDWKEAPQQIGEALASIGIEFAAIDYLILNHIEPDHTGWLKEFRALNPHCEILSTDKGCKLVKSFYKIEAGVRAVKDGDMLDLGKGQILTFIEAPNVHWPETMFTWHEASGTLFPCDAFGSFGALGDRVFDDTFTDEERAFFEKETIRYYANIVSSFSLFVEKAVQKVKHLDIQCIAPSHGIVWRKNPQKIIDLYSTYASYAKGPADKEIAVIWSSMYGNTKAGLDAVIRGIEAEGVPYTIHRVPDEDASYILADAWKSSALVIAMPTYEYAMFPPMAYIIDLFKRKHLFGKTVLRIGSFGWIGGAKKEYEAAIDPLKWTSLESREWAGFPSQEDLADLEKSGRQLAQIVKHR
ncbi:MAG: FprA family A-type flavoprotein [Treponema sp.]|jgi:flavorubredoxin|nr:FprA family A-type flavoprotein [Treponema sp.]